MKKICLVSHTLQMGGMERAISEFANFICNKENVDVYMILMLKVDMFYKLNDKIKIIEPDFKYEKKSRLFYLIKMLIWLRSEVKKIKPDTIMSFGEYWNSLMLTSTFGLGIPRYISDRSKPTIDWKGFTEFVRKITYSGANGFIAQTNLSADIVKKRYRLVNSVVVGNPIREIRYSTNIPRQNIIVSVGRLIEYKQFDRLIDIFSQTSNMSNWKLLILGDGPLMNKLQDIVNRKGLNEYVVLKGSVSNVDQYLTKSKIFAFTSFYEGFPNALAEGMMAGCACISFDCEAGPSDIITDGVNGSLIPLNDDKLYVEKLEELMCDDLLINKYSRIGTQTIQKYRFDIVNEKIFDFILQKF